MSDYIEPIFIALIIFSAIAMLIFVPWLIYIYRKLGYFPVSTTLIVFSFIFYFLAAFLLTLLPLPDTRQNCIVASASKANFSFVPFQFVKDLLRETNVDWNSPSTYVYLFKERAFYQAFFNFLLLMPFGVYLRYFLQKRRAWYKALLIIFAVTLGYEITQVTGIYGIYECPYRLFDIDDLLLNTAGGVLGFFIAPILLALFPSRARIQQKADELLEKDEVRNMIILLAMLVDIIIVQTLSGIVAAFLNITDIWSMLIIHTVALAVCLVIVPMLLRGQTIGAKLMRFRYTHDKLARKLTKRMLAVFLIYAIAFVGQVLNQLDVAVESSYYVITILFKLMSIAIYFVMFIVLLVHSLIILTSKGKRRFFFDEYAQLSVTRKKL